MRKVHHDVHRTDRQTVAILAVGIHDRECLLIHAHHGRASGTPLLVDDTTLLVNLLAFEQEVMTPVVEDEQTGIQSTSCLHIHIVDVIDGLVERGVGIQVFTEFHTDAFQILLQAVTGEVGGAVETHVFEEVCQTTLVLILLNGTHLLCNVEESTLLWPFVVTQIICQSVGQCSLAHCRVHRDGRILCRCGDE